MRRRLVEEPGDLRSAWEARAQEAIAWFQTPGHDSYWRFHRDQFLELLPPPGRRTLDIGCGEGRLSRDLKALDHEVVALDGSPTAVAAARAADSAIETVVGDAARLPWPDGFADLAVAFMSLQDIDDAARAIREAARVLEPGGRFCLAIVHPLMSAGQFDGDDADSAFVIRGTYLDRFRYADELDRDGLTMTFESEHRPLGWYFDALQGADFLVERVQETDFPDSAMRAEHHPRYRRLPLFLHVRALRP